MLCSGISGSSFLVRVLLHSGYYCTLPFSASQAYAGLSMHYQVECQLSGDSGWQNSKCPQQINSL